MKNLGLDGYGLAIAQEWEKIYFTRNIPGCGFALLFGNAFYAWQAGRLGAKVEIAALGSLAGPNIFSSDLSLILASSKKLWAISRRGS